MSTLSRTLEPEVMDTPEEAHDYDAMDHSAVNRLFVEDFLTCYSGKGPVLDVGTGTAQIPIVLCQLSAAKVVAVDAAQEMLALAEQNVARAGLAQRIELRRIDAKRMSFAEGEFPAVVSNSIVHHIPQPRDVLAEMVRVLQVGGVIFVRDLLRPASLDELSRLVQLYAADASVHGREMFTASLHAALTLEEIRDLVRGLGQDPEAVRQTSDRHWTWSSCKRGTRP